jgi:hypothetical protein
MMARQVRPTLSKPVTPIGLYEVALMIRRKRADSIRARGTDVLIYTGRIYGRNPDLLVANIDEIILQTGMGPYMGPYRGCHGSPKNSADIQGTYRVDEQRLL